MKSKSGRETTVYYYHAYDENGVRRSYSTGKKTKIFDEATADFVKVSNQGVQS